MSQPLSQELPDSSSSATLSDHLDRALLAVDRIRDRSSAVTAGVAALAVLVGLGFWLMQRPDDSAIDDLIPMADSDEVGAAAPSPVEAGAIAGGNPVEDRRDEEVKVELVVHVVGAVLSPGLVTLPEGSRVSQAVQAAGGPTPAADVHALNLASPVADGMQIVVPEVGEEVNGPLLRLAAGSSEQASAGPVDLNLATEAQLTTLPGIGPATAAKIVAWRSQNGAFEQVDDLLAVPGIGPAKLEGLRDLVIV